VIVNAIAHRDYNITGTAIQVRMFDDRLEVESPGGLPGIVTVENIRRRHFSRNPHVVGVLKTWRYMEELGFGMDRVFREMEAAGAPSPLITDDRGMVTVTLYAIRPVVPPDVACLGLNKRQTQALAILADRGQITNRDYRELFVVSHTTAAADLRDLITRGLIKQVGTGRGTYYRAVDDSLDENLMIHLMQIFHQKFCCSRLA